MSAITPALPRVRALPARFVLGAIVLLGAALQIVLAHSIVSPDYFPDEYLYSQLGRSLATTGHLTVRGVDPHFLPVLAPVLNAPFWLLHDVNTAFRLVQAENALFLSLAAVPTYMLARRLGSSAGLALGAAALAVAAPPAMFSARLLAEPVAYPLSIAVVAAAVAAIDRPSLRSHALLLGLGTLATLARLQLAALPLCAAIAIVVVGVRERRLRAALREQRLLLGLVGGALLVGLAVLFLHGFGYYHLAPRARSVGGVLRIAGVDAFVVVLATGAALAPSALVGLGLSVWRPRTRRELAFGSLVLVFAAMLLAQCVLWGDVGLVQERYLGYLIPLLAIAFCVRCSRLDRRPLAEIAVAAAVAAFAALVPISGYARDGETHLSPTFYAYARAMVSLHDAGTAAAVFALGGTALVAVGVLAASFRRAALPVLLVSVAGAATLLVLATSWSSAISTADARAFLPVDKQWVDHAAPEGSTMIVVGKATSGATLPTLFWNPSIRSVMRLPLANGVDWLPDPVARPSAEGTLISGGKPLNGDVVVAADPASTVLLAGARKAAAIGPTTLWRATGTPRLAAIMHGRLLNSRVLHGGKIELWNGGAPFAGWIELRVSTPHELGTGTVQLRGRGASSTARVAAGASRVVRVAACGAGPWRGSFAAAPVGPIDNRWESPIVSAPRYVPDPRACS